MTTEDFYEINSSKHYADRAS